MHVSPEARFLELLGLKAEKPSREFLSRILHSHLQTAPWENVSKLLRKRDGNLTLPTFSEYVRLLDEHQFGGTCHAQNTHFAHFLIHLGFDASVVSAIPEGLPSHVAIKIKLENQKFCIDLGLMSSIAGVFSLDPKRAFEKKVGDQRFAFKPLPDGDNWSLQIYRNDKIVRSYKSTSTPLDSVAHTHAIRDSFADEANFMKVLAVHRQVGDRDVGIWNNKLYIIRGVQSEVRPLKSVDELAKAFSNFLLLPKYPLHDAIEVLNNNKVDIFSVVD
jgi:arylamine N-acetyltransferase